MKDLFTGKMAALRPALQAFAAEVGQFSFADAAADQFAINIAGEMRTLGYDDIHVDDAGNVVGVIKGYGRGPDMVMLSPVDFRNTNGPLRGKEAYGLNDYKVGVVTSVYAGAVLARSFMPLSGDLVICCVPRTAACAFGTRYLFERTLAERKVKGVVLSEPTGYDIFLGNKGRMEYEISVNGNLDREFMQRRGVNILGAMFPLINELEAVSSRLPGSAQFGDSTLSVKDVSYQDARFPEEHSEFKVLVERTFDEREDEEGILQRAMMIARQVYADEPGVGVSTALAESRIRTVTGGEIVAARKYAPWRLESHHPFALSALQVLRENGYETGVGYWRERVTDGSLTCGELGIPTIGFGAGSESGPGPGPQGMGREELERSILGKALIAQRAIGIPTFGWGDDEI